ncbi:MAG: ABC transporter ATP-binding protein [Velocimicrobium sp.]
MIKTAKELLSLMGKKEKQRVILSVLYSFFDFSLLVVPIIIAFVMVEQILQGTLLSSKVISYTVIMVICLIIRIILRIYSLKLRSGSGYITMCDERKRLGKDLRNISMGYFNEKNLGDLISTITSDALIVELEGIGVIEKLAAGIPSLIATLILLFVMDYRIMLAVALLLIPVWFSFKYLAGTSDRYNLHRQKEIGETTEEVVEFIKGLKVLKTYNMTDKQFYKTQNAFDKLKKLSIKTELSHIPPTAVFQLGFRVITVVIITISALFTLSGDFAFSNTFLLMLASLSILGAVELMGIWSIFSKMTAEAIERMTTIKNVSKQSQSSGKSEIDKFDIEFKHVDFAYQTKPILKDVSFIVPEKTATALVGLSGSGKTTITNLIARFWDATSGEVRIGDENVKEVNYDNLLQNISFVFQSVFLFDDTVLDNIRIGRPTATREEVIEVAKKAHCHDFIMEMENGYDTIIGEEGTKLSGGEKQRISIARALIKNAPIILLDEVTANVDVENEMQIQSALSELLKNKTVIMIAHKLSTIKDVEQILVINDGQVCERGTHKELLSRSKIYAKLWDLQQSTESWNI